MNCMKMVGVFVGAIVLLVGCGSTSQVGTQNSSDDTGQDRATDHVAHQNLAMVAIADNVALVADGALPTRFSSAHLTSNTPTDLVAVEAPNEVVSRVLIGVGDSILMIGNRCDQGVSSDGIEYRCEPGTPTALSYAPDSGEWTEYTIGADLGNEPFSGAIAQPTGPSRATVLTSVDSDEKGGAGLRLFTVDTSKQRLIPADLPDGFRQDPQGQTEQCLGADGSVMLVSTSTNEPVAGATPSRAWRRPSASSQWVEVPLPPSGSYPWSPAGCIGGDLMLSTPGAGTYQEAIAAPRRVLFDAKAESHWEELPVDAMPDGLPTGGPVHGQVNGASLRWFGSQLWEFDHDRGKWTRISVSEAPNGAVRWTAPWVDSKLVALVDSSQAPNDGREPMSLKLQVLSIPDGSE